MVRATRVTNPLSRALGAGIFIGALAASLFLIAGPASHDGAETAAMTTVAKVEPAR